MDTYHSQSEAEADKAHLVCLRDAIDVSPAALRLDDCRLWTLKGKRGYVSSWGAGAFLLTVGCRSPQAWTWAKKRLLGWSGLVDVTQDGDDEGVFHLHRLPIPGEAEDIRALVGLRKRTVWADPEAARARGYRLADRRTSQTSEGEFCEISGKLGSPKGDGPERRSRSVFEGTPALFAGGQS
ncbi:hypothetical protein BB934_22380 [Microvirga ossetica]|uniref:Uncharacterized protein n=1 Tax=Microvirga ossetica TaxID=1882682 RepID=A0A1B2EL12_9HYPH|nr:hypothetical protein [Microvirga ossetica]ANY80637.1 hypothetical protein BB934_22380 [Microvirga ossetica]